MLLRATSPTRASSIRPALRCISKPARHTAPCVYRKLDSARREADTRYPCHLMIESLRLILHIIASFFKPRTKLVAEILILRQQLNVLRRQVSKRPQLSNTDRFLFVWLYRWFPSV